ncbi:MAG: hypothetical protein Kow0029_13990 [Candidatus Rifleibacteriota bacterium]
MNQLTKSIFATIVILVVFFFLGKIFILSGLQKEISQTENLIAQLENNKRVLEQDLEKYRQKAKQEIKSTKNNIMLESGKEFSLLKTLLECKGNMKIQNFELLPSYYVKNKEEDNFMTNSIPDMKLSETLPELDEQGMPINAVSEEVTEWPGVEIIPIKFSFTTTYRSLGMFFSKVDKLMPINVVRSMDVLIEDSGITRGTVVLLFPIAEK